MNPCGSWTAVPPKSCVGAASCSRYFWASTPVIMATARGNDEDVWTGWRAGADHYLVKPFDPEELQSVARRLVAEGGASA